MKRRPSWRVEARIRHTVRLIKLNPTETDERIRQAVMSSWEVTRPTAQKYIRLAKRRIEWGLFVAECESNGTVITPKVVNDWYDKRTVQS
jgi:hypothetical protein